MRHPRTVLPLLTTFVVERDSFDDVVVTSKKVVHLLRWNRRPNGCPHTTASYYLKSWAAPYLHELIAGSDAHILTNLFRRDGPDFFPRRVDLDGHFAHDFLRNAATAFVIDRLDDHRQRRYLEKFTQLPARNRHVWPALETG